MHIHSANTVSLLNKSVNLV